MENYKARLATIEDIPFLHTLIEASVRGLQKNDYTQSQIDGALGTVLGLDTQLVKDGTYFVIENNQQIVGCGGWSHRKTLFGSDHGPDRKTEFLDPKGDPAKIRAFFIRPDFARKGIGSLLLEVCEKAAMAAGFTSFEMGATLTGVPLYEAKGYKRLQRIEVPLHNGDFLQVIKMSKGNSSISS